MGERLTAHVALHLTELDIWFAKDKAKTCGMAWLEFVRRVANGTAVVWGVVGEVRLELQRQATNVWQMELVAGREGKKTKRRELEVWRRERWRRSSGIPVANSRSLSTTPNGGGRGRGK